MLIAMLRTFLVFFVGGLLMTATVICLLLIGDTVCRHCLDDKSNLTCGDALLFVAVSPVYGIGIGMALNFLLVFPGFLRKARKVGSSRQFDSAPHHLKAPAETLGLSRSQQPQLAFPCPAADVATSA
jgi:hypothetical protein